MTPRAITAIAVLALSSAGCVGHPHEETAALRSTWPADGSGSLAAATPRADLPSVKGDILAGTSPAELATARARVSQPLTEALAKP